jgi:hypothetical protein
MALHLYLGQDNAHLTVLKLSTWSNLHESPRVEVTNNWKQDGNTSRLKWGTGIYLPTRYMVEYSYWFEHRMVLLANTEIVGIGVEGE